MTETPPPTLEHALEILAHHLQCLSVEKQMVGLHFYGGVSVKVEVTPAGPEDNDRGLWDQVSFDGVRVGNRCAAVKEYTKRCAPVLAKIARGEPL